MTDAHRRANRAGRPGARTAPAAAAGRISTPEVLEPGLLKPGPNAVLIAHVGLVILLAVSTLVLFGVPSDDGSWVAILGLVTIGELVAVLVAIAIAGTTGHHAPLVAVDAIIAVPLVALVGSGLAGASGPGMVAGFVGVVLLVVAVASALLAARVVRGRRVERVVLAFALVLVAAFASAVVIAELVPIVILVVLFGPELELPGPRRAGEPRASDRRSATERHSTAPVVARRGAPDAAAVLGRSPTEAVDPTPNERR